MCMTLPVNSVIVFFLNDRISISVNVIRCAGFSFFFLQCKCC